MTKDQHIAKISFQVLRICNLLCLIKQNLQFFPRTFHKSSNLKHEIRCQLSSTKTKMLTYLIYHTSTLLPCQISFYISFFFYLDSRCALLTLSVNCFIINWPKNNHVTVCTVTTSNKLLC